MRVLIAEDDFACRRLIQRSLEAYGHCDVAVNGVEAIDAFTAAIEEGRPYDLVCLDIMMPEMDGHETLAILRTREEEQGIHGHDCVKVIMTTALQASKHVFGAFREGCEAYLVKPIERRKLLEEIERLGLEPSRSE